MPKYVVLKVLPQGQQPGEIVELHEDVGNVFITAEVVRKATAADEKRTPTTQRPRYQRRDLTAVGSDTSSED